MKALISLMLGLSAASASAAPTSRAPVEHFTRPPVNGRAMPLSDAVRLGDTLYLSGQLGFGADGKLADGVEAQTKAAMDNIGAILKRAGAEWDDVVHCTAFLADMKDWAAFNAVYVPYFPSGKMPARSAVGVNGLALGGLVEIECQAYAGSR
jgi:reactive intermediate/imine deaminase